MDAAPRAGNWWDALPDAGGPGTQAMVASVPKDDQKRLADMTDHAAKIQQMANLAQQFMTFNNIAPNGTGPVNGLGIGHFTVGDMKAATDSAVGQMSSISKKMIPLQREVGTGPIRVGEISGPGGGIWGGDVPRLNAAHDVNGVNASGWQQDAAYARAYRDWNQSWASQRGNLNGSDAAFNAWWPQALAQKAAQRQAGGSGAQPQAQPQTGPQAAPQPQQQAAPPPAPQFGDVQDGHTFVGGKGSDPADPANWRPVNAQGQ